MKNKINLAWVKNLNEVGSPIRNGADSVANQIADADKRLKEAQQLHTECLAEIKRQAAGLEREIARLWTPAEIDAAKRGMMLLEDGREVAL